MRNTLTLCFIAGVVAGSPGCHLAGGKAANPGTLARDPNWNVVAGVAEVRQSTREDCGAAALAMVLGFWERSQGINGLGAGPPVPINGGIKASVLRDQARSLGLEAFVFAGTFEDLAREIDLRHPVVVGVLKRAEGQSFQHYQVVVGINPRSGEILVIDPAVGARVYRRGDFLKEWKSAGMVTLAIFPRTRIPVAMLRARSL